VLVQPYWSNTFGAFIVPGHTPSLLLPTQQFDLAPNWHVTTSGGVTTASFDGTYALTVNGDQRFLPNDTIVIDVVNGGVQVSLNGETVQFDPGTITSVTVNSGAGSDVIDVYRTIVPVTVNSSGPATVNVGVGGSMQGIQANVTVYNGPDYDTLNLDDSADGASHTTVPVVVSASGVSGLSPAPVLFTSSSVSSLTVRGGSGNNRYVVTGTPAPNSVNLYTGTGADTVNVQATTAALTINAQGTADAVTVSNAGRINAIQNNVTVTGPGTANLTVDDSSDPAAAVTTVGAATVGGVNYGTVYVHPNGPTLGTIYYDYAHTSGVTVRTGVSPAVNVLATGQNVPVTLVNQANSYVYVGQNNRLQSIRGPLTVQNQPGPGVLELDDSADPAPYTNGVYFDTYTPAGDTVYGSVTGLAPAAINYRASGVSNVIAHGGTGDNAVGVYTTPAGVRTDLYANGSYNQFVVYADGEGSLAGPGLNGPVYLHGNPNTASTVSFAEYYDYSSPGGQTYTLTANSVSRGGAAPVIYDHLGEMILFASQFGGNTVNVLGNAAGNYANLAVAAGDQVNIGSTAPTLGGSLSTILGTVGVGGSAVPVTVDDSGNTSPTARNVTFRQDTYGINMLGLTDDPEGDIIYNLDAASSVTVLGEAGNTTYHLQDFLAGVPLTLNAGGGTNTLDYSAATGNVYVNLQTGVATDLAGFRNIQNVVGASGGPAGSYNILVGDGGNVLTGGTGRRNLLIAGPTASTLIGGDSGDILVAGTTDYDTDAASLQAIMAY
jgi:hypothetical protein